MGEREARTNSQINIPIQIKLETDDVSWKCIDLDYDLALKFNKSSDFLYWKIPLSSSHFCSSSH